MTTWDADEIGYFGDFGGRFMPEALVAALDELTAAWQDAMADPGFIEEFAAIQRDYAGIPSPLYEASRLSEKVGVRILLKREDLNHTGAHKIRNVLGQALLTKRMGKTRVIAETGAGQHGVASATAAAYFGLDCTVYMGSVDTRRQALNVARMHLLGAKVVPVDSGSATLKDAINEALRDWVASVDHTAYLFGTAAGPHPFPSMVRDFTRAIGDEARQQCLDRYGGLPDAIAACVGGGSNAIGLFTAFLDDEDVAIYGFEPGGEGVDTPRHAATIHAGDTGVLHGARTYVLQDEDGQTIESHSISAGLDYPGVGPQHAHLSATGRATYLPVTDAEAMDAMALLSRTEGIIPAIESAHAVAGALRHGGAAPGRQGPRRDHAGQPLRPRRQGHGHRDRVVRARRPRRESPRSRVGWRASPVAFEKARAEGRAALVGYLPAGFPDVAGGIEALTVMVDAGLRRHRGRPALQRPGHGRPDHPGRRPAGPRGRRPHHRRAAHRRGGRGDRRADGDHDLLEPRREVRRQRFAADLANAGGAGLITPDLTPDSAARVDRRGRRARPRQDLPGRPVVHRRADRDDDRAAAASSTPPPSWA